MLVFSNLVDQSNIWRGQETSFLAISVLEAVVMITMMRFSLMLKTRYKRTFGTVVVKSHNMVCLQEIESYLCSQKRGGIRQT